MSRHRSTMRRADWVRYVGGKQVEVLVGHPPRRIPAVDVIGLRLWNSRRRGDHYTVYMTPDEAADHIRVFSIALSVVTRRKRGVFARRPR